MDQNAFDRLESLIEMGKSILQSATTSGGRLRRGFVTQETYRTPISYGIDIQLTSQWRTSCLSLLEALFGNESAYYKSFESRMSQLIYGRVRMALGILIAVKNDHQLEEVMPRKTENAKTLEEWAGSQHLSLALVFTDIVESTEIGRKLGDAKWINELFTHFSKGREIASRFDSYVVKVIGDSLMVAFRTASDAVSFAIEFGQNTGVDHIGIRVGINSGDVEIRENDIYGLNVNFTSRVQHALPAEGILVASSVKEDYQKQFGEVSAVQFDSCEVDLKSFGRRTVYSARSFGLAMARTSQRKARSSIFEFL